MTKTLPYLVPQSPHHLSAWSQVVDPRCPPKWAGNDDLDGTPRRREWWSACQPIPTLPGYDSNFIQIKGPSGKVWERYGVIGDRILIIAEKGASLQGRDSWREFTTEPIGHIWMHTEEPRHAVFSDKCEEVLHQNGETTRHPVETTTEFFGPFTLTGPKHRREFEALVGPNSYEVSNPLGWIPTHFDLPWGAIRLIIRRGWWGHRPGGVPIPGEPSSYAYAEDYIYAQLTREVDGVQTLGRVGWQVWGNTGDAPVLWRRAIADRVHLDTGPVEVA